MSNDSGEKKEAEKKGSQTERCDRALLCPEEWTDPAGRKVIGEYHKEGLTENMTEVDADLESFEEFWNRRGSSALESEYHKEGAPHIWETEHAGGDRSTSPASEEKAASGPPSTSATRGEVSREGEPSTAGRGDARQSAIINRPIDLNTLEIISYALFRVIFGKGVRIPIKRENLIDMDIVIRDKEILVNTNQLYFAIPELAVWRIVYTHRGKAVLEFGRGVRKGMKIHWFRALLLALESWKGGRKGMQLRSASQVAIKETTERGA